MSSEQQEHTQERKLARVLNALLGGAIVVGGAIGVGILRTPGIVAGQLAQPLLILVVWVAGGLLALLGANCIAEMAAALPEAGGPYVYARRAFGPAGGIALGWGDWLISVTGLATLSVTIAEYVIGGSGALPTHILAVALVAAFALLNWFGLELGARTQQVLSALKVAGLIILAALAIAVGENHGLHVTTPVKGGYGGILLVVSAIVIIHETYAGWNSSVYFAEEDREPTSNVPKALFWGIAAIMFAYVLFNVGLLAILPMQVLASSKLPAAEAAQRIFGPSGHMMVRVFAVISLCGILNVIVMFTPRIVFAMSRDGLLPSSLSALNRAAVPGVAMIVSIVPAAALAAGLTFETLFVITAFLGLATNVAAFAAFFKLRLSEPELKRPFRAWGYPWLPLLALVVSMGLLGAFVMADPVSSGIAVAAMLVAWPVFGLAFKRRTPQEKPI